MSTSIPTSEQVREQLLAMSSAQIAELSKLSEVPYRSLWKIRQNDTKNPGVDTVGRFWPHVKTAKRVKA